MTQDEYIRRKMSIANDKAEQLSKVRDTINAIIQSNFTAKRKTQLILNIYCCKG